MNPYSNRNGHINIGDVLQARANSKLQCLDRSEASKFESKKRYGPGRKLCVRTRFSDRPFVTLAPYTFGARCAHLLALSSAYTVLSTAAQYIITG